MYSEKIRDDLTCARVALMAAEATMCLVRKKVDEAYMLDRFDETLRIIRQTLTETVNDP